MRGQDICLTLALSTILLALEPQPGHAQWHVGGVQIGPDGLNPQMVSDGLGGAIVVWINGAQSNVLAQRLDAAGNPLWTSGGVPLVRSDAAYRESAVITSDGSHGAIVAWIENTPAAMGVRVQHVLASGVVDPAWTAANGNPDGTVARGTLDPPNGSLDVTDLEIVSDAAGGAIVTWADGRDFDGDSGPPYHFTYRWDVYAQKVRASGFTSWTTNGVPVCVYGLDQKFPRIVEDGGGGAYITWSDVREFPLHPGFNDHDIYAQHILATGIVACGWPVNGAGLCTEVHSQDSPQICAGGSGAIVIWYDSRGGTARLFAQHVLPENGADPTWPVDGVSLCTACVGQVPESTISDGFGGAIVTWGDTRSGGNQAYSQHLLSTGAVDGAWPADGRLLCAACDVRSIMSSVTDGTHGSIAAWWGMNPFQVYAQHVLASGVVDPAWPAGAVVLAVTSTPQYQTPIVSDGAGGGIVSWVGSIDVQHVDGGGAVVGVGAGARWTGVQAVPNPSTAGATIRFNLPTQGPVSVYVYDVSGQRVRTLVERRTFAAGSHELSWEGRNDSGNPMRAGVYFVRVTAAGQTVASKITILR